MIEQKLREYKSNLSKLKLIECSMKQIESEIQVLEPSYISAYAFSDTPPSKTNKVFSPVENIVLEEEAKREKVNRLKDQLWDLARERMELKLRIEEVEAYLIALGAEERFIIEQFYFEKLTWRMVAERYRKEFGNYISREPLRKKKKAALEKMEKILCPA